MKILFLFPLCVFVDSALSQEELKFNVIVQTQEEEKKPLEEVRIPFESVPVVETRYLVSELYCRNCPAAKTRFLASGGDKSRIIKTDIARSLGQIVKGVPHEFTLRQPREYRRETKPVFNVEKKWNYTREELLLHLRTHENHKGKIWQGWYLENWSIEMLQALHDDDHLGGVLQTSRSSQNNSQSK